MWSQPRWLFLFASPETCESVIETNCKDMPVHAWSNSWFPCGCCYLLLLFSGRQQIMLWERKIQIAKETKATLNSDAMAGEIRNLKTDVHVFQVSQLHALHKDPACCRNSIRDMASSSRSPHGNFYWSTTVYSFHSQPCWHTSCMAWKVLGVSCWSFWSPMNVDLWLKLPYVHDVSY